MGDPVEDVVFLPGEQGKFESFMAERSPNKWKTFQSLHPERPTARRLRASLVLRYRQLQQLATIDSARYESEVAVIGIEDEVYGILQDQRQGALTAQDADAKLRDRAVALLEVRHKWRQMRLGRIEDELRQMKLGDAAQAVKRELDRETAGGGSAMPRKVKEKQVDALVERFKDSAKGIRMFNRPLPGGDRPPGPDGRPPAEPTAPADPQGPAGGER